MYSVFLRSPETAIRITESWQLWKTKSLRKHIKNRIWNGKSSLNLPLLNRIVVSFYHLNNPPTRNAFFSANNRNLNFGPEKNREPAKKDRRRCSQIDSRWIFFFIGQVFLPQHYSLKGFEIEVSLWSFCSRIEHGIVGRNALTIELHGY